MINIQPGCGPTINTGFSGCKIDMKLIVAALMMPASWSFALDVYSSQAEQITALKAELLGKISENQLINRAQLIGRFTGFTDNSEAANVQTLGYGAKVVTNEGNYTFMFEHRNGSGTHALYRQLNGKEGSYKPILIDRDGNFAFAASFNDNGTFNSVSGLDLNMFYADPQKLPTYTETNVYGLHMSLVDVRQLNELGASIALGASFLDSLEDAQVINLTAEAKVQGTRTFKLVLKNSSSGEVISAGSTALTSALADVDNWDIRDTTTGALMGISSITINESTGVISIVIYMGEWIALNYARIQLYFNNNPGDPLYHLQIAPDLLVQLH